MNIKVMKDSVILYQERKRIGKRIAAIREECCLSEEDLAEITGLKAGTISMIEDGRFNVNIDILATIAEALHKKLDFV